MKNTVIYMALFASVLAFKADAKGAVRKAYNTGETSTASDGDQVDPKGQKPTTNFPS